MGSHDLELSRISKLLVDKDKANVAASLARRQAHTVMLTCGADIAESTTLQLGVLTAAHIARRCFPGAVRIALDPALKAAPLRVWPWLRQTFGPALAEIIEPQFIAAAPAGARARGVLVFGNAPEAAGALRVTFDGWIAKVGPVQNVARLPERPYFTAVGVLASALALSEIFLSFAGITVQATRRTVALSLWRPEADVADPEALGVPVRHLPRAFWALGLGHLGNAYLWTLATLPYADPKGVEFFLNDFDKVEPENVETGLIFESDDPPGLKTRVCSAWLERRKFQTRITERPFDSAFRCRPDEPQLALCGFDSNPARRDLPGAGFRRVIEAGLGGTASNCDTISFHTLPHARAAADLWPDLSAEETAKRMREQERAARENPGYAPLAKDECGRVLLAGKSVAVPFVGAAAASLVVAEAVRLLHGGPAYSDIRLSLGTPAKFMARRLGDYGVEALPGMAFCDAET
jgi:hypothetical protein